MTFPLTLSLSFLLPLVAALAVAVAGVGIWSTQALRLVDADARLSAEQRFYPAFFGATLLCTGALLQSGLPSLPLLLAHAVVGALLGVLTVMDRETAWAPDGLTLPLCVLGTVLGDLSNDKGFGILLSGFAGIGLFILAQGLWWLQDRLGQRAVPPADMIALVLPAVLLDVTMALVAFYLLTSILILGCRLSPGFARVFSKPQAISAAEEDIGYGAPAITFLSVAFPILCVLIAVKPLFAVL